MRYSRLTVGIVVVSLLAVTVASGPAAAQLEGTDQEEAEICGGAPSGNSLVIVLPGDTYVHSDDEATLLPGTTGELALCSDGELQTAPSAWDVDEGTVTGVNVTAEHEYSYAITVESVEDSTQIEFQLSRSPGSVESPAVTATPGKVAVARVGGDAYRVTVAGDSERKEFRRADASYTATLDEMRTAAANLDENAGQFDPDPGVPDDERLPQINQTRAVTANYSTIQTVLFRSATSGNAEAVAALDAYEERHVAAISETRESLESTNRAIARRAGSIAWGVIGNLVAVGLVGLVVGGIGGRYLTNRILSDVEVDRRRSSAVDFRRKHLVPQLLGAFVLVVAAVALVVTQGLLDPLVAVVAAVIGL